MSDPLSRQERNGAGEEGDIAWGVVLLWFMRIVAIAWIVKGLASWLIILGTDPFGNSLETLPPPQRGVVVVFAVLDLVAGVGLWLTSAWGGVMWLLAAMTDLIAFALGASPPNSSAILVGPVVALVLAYLVLSWLASRGE